MQAPNQGDFIWIKFSPQAGSEQAGTRPAIVLSPQKYNQAAGLCLVCPITSQIKGYPFEYVIPSNPHIAGVILTDQLKSIDWTVRGASFIETKLDAETLSHIMKKILLLLPSL